MGSLNLDTEQARTRSLLVGYMNLHLFAHFLQHKGQNLRNRVPSFSNKGVRTISKFDDALVWKLLYQRHCDIEADRFVSAGLCDVYGNKQLMD